jgi:ATP-dependent exoDNAse (exonuclease V) alpha subunit
MARGWESKSVEEQVEQQQSSEPAKQSRLAGEQAAAHARRERERQALELQRERILDERTSNPIRRKALHAALEEIEAKLKAL